MRHCFSYRILNAFDDRLQLIDMSKSKCTICIKLSKAIKIHKRSLKCVLINLKIIHADNILI